MARIGHGEIDLRTRTGPAGGPGPASVRVAADGGAASIGLAAESGFTPPPGHTRYGYMFPQLQQDAGDRLPDGPATLEALKRLGELLVDAPEESPVGGALGKGDSRIPSAYTYLGQFIDHDITFDQGSATIVQLGSSTLAPLASLDGLANARSCRLDLDRVYAGAPRDGDRLRIGRVTPLNGTAPPLLPVPGKSPLNDLPRQSRSTDARTDRAALIGDPRNDENTIVAQLHTAFLKAHNALVAEGREFDAAMRALRQRYQHMVLHDFLEAQVCDPEVIADVLASGPRFWRLGNATELFMPAEFAVAAYRFGHSMIRSLYDFNLNFEPANLGLLFTFTALSGELGQDIGLPPEQTETLPENWVIQWERFLPLDGATPQRARKIDCRLSDFTFDLRNTFGRPQSDTETDPQAKRIASILATRNLLRGFLFRLPTGQAVARSLGETALEGDSLLDALPTDAIRAAAEPFASRTPLWFYLLAEAGDPSGANGEHLGRVGSRILGETFWNLVRFSNDSVLNPEVELDFERFTLSDLVTLAGREDGA